MTICAARATQEPAVLTCHVDIGDGRTGCRCRVEVEAAIEQQTAVGQARIPDSARGEVA